MSVERMVGYDWEALVESPSDTQRKKANANLVTYVVEWLYENGWQDAAVCVQRGDHLTRRIVCACGRVLMVYRANWNGEERCNVCSAVSKVDAQIVETMNARAMLRGQSGQKAKATRRRLNGVLVELRRTKASIESTVKP